MMGPITGPFPATYADCADKTFGWFNWSGVAGGSGQCFPTKLGATSPPPVPSIPTQPFLSNEKDCGMITSGWGAWSDGLCTPKQMTNAPKEPWVTTKSDCIAKSNGWANWASINDVIGTCSPTAPGVQPAVPTSPDSATVPHMPTAWTFMPEWQRLAVVLGCLAAFVGIVQIFTGKRGSHG